jgi:hypothetical protein
MFYLILTLLTTLYGLIIFFEEYKLKTYFRQSFLRYSSIPFPQRQRKIIGLVISIWGIVFTVDALIFWVTGRLDLAGVFLLGDFYIMIVIMGYAYRVAPRNDVDNQKGGSPR